MSDCRTGEGIEVLNYHHLIAQEGNVTHLEEVEPIETKSMASHPL